jgi:hypothetical protein
MANFFHSLYLKMLLTVQKESSNVEFNFEYNRFLEVGITVFFFIAQSGRRAGTVGANFKIWTWSIER